MKISVITTAYPYGGAEYQAHLLAKHTAECSLIDVSSTHTLRELDGVEVIGLGLDVILTGVKSRLKRFFIRKFVFLSLFFKIKNLDSERLVFFNILFLPVAFCLSFTSKDVVISIREYKKHLFSPLTILLLKRIKVTTNTPRVRNELAKKGIPCKLFLNVLPENVVECKVERKRVNNTVLVVSNLQPHKGVHVLLNACIDLPVTINICGRIDNKRYFNELNELSTNSVCRINFLGPVDRSTLDDFYSTCSVFVHPSTMEGTSNAILDAINFRAPLIISDIPENAYLCDDFDDFLFAEGDVTDLKNKVVGILNTPPSEGYLYKLNYLKKRVYLKFSVSNLKAHSNYITACKEG